MIKEESYSPFSLEEQTALVEQVRTFINEMEGLPSEVLLDDFNESLPSICLRTKNGGRKGRYNVDGGYYADFPYAIYVKINPAETDSRLTAIKLLNKIAIYFEQKTKEKDLPILNEQDIALSLEMTSFPYLSEEESDNKEIYHAICNLEYRHKSIHE